MRNDLTDITILMDRSGSMRAMREQAIAALNEFVCNQKSVLGECRLTFVQFDNFVETVFEDKNIKDVLQLSLTPRGGTALLDAFGDTMVATGVRLSKIAEEQRPGLVVFVVLTDGHENASSIWSQNRVAVLAKQQAKVYKWQFIYLGANQDAFAVADGIGVAPDGVANYSEEKTSSALSFASNNVSRMRSMTSKGMAPVNKYTAQELADMK